MTTSIQAQEKLDSASYFNSEMKLEKRVIVDLALKLNQEEASSFWDLYIEFNSKIDKLDEMWLFLINEAQKQSATIDNERADLIWKEFNKYINERQILFDAYYTKFSKVVPSSKVFRYYMVENKIDAVVNGEIAKKLEIENTPPVENK